MPNHMLRTDPFDVAKRAQLRPDDFAKLIGVTRVTVSGWFNGHHRPHALLVDRVAHTLDAIEQALTEGTLPVPAGISRRERHFYIRRTADRYLTT